MVDDGGGEEAEEAAEEEEEDEDDKDVAHRLTMGLEASEKSNTAEGQACWRGEDALSAAYKPQKRTQTQTLN